VQLQPLGGGAPLRAQRPWQRHPRSLQSAARRRAAAPGMRSTKSRRSGCSAARGPGVRPSPAATPAQRAPSPGPAAPVVQRGRQGAMRVGGLGRRGVEKQMQPACQSSSRTRASAAAAPRPALPASYYGCHRLPRAHRSGTSLREDDVLFQMRELLTREAPKCHVASHCPPRPFAPAAAPAPFLTGRRPCACACTASPPPELRRRCEIENVVGELWNGVCGKNTV
jgi:hypothetical protein